MNNFQFTSFLALLLTILSLTSTGQTLVDDFDRPNNTTVSGGWSEVQTLPPASVRINSNELLLGGAATGRDFVARPTGSMYDPILTNNTCMMTWAFNMRQEMNNPSGFNNSNSGIAVVLAGNNISLLQGNGYAVVLGQPGNQNPLRLVHYTGGLGSNSNLTDIISASAFSKNYLDVRVTYNPITDTWELFYTDQGTGPFGDPRLASTSGGTAVDTTYTSSSLNIIGCLWNHSNDKKKGHVDNYYVANSCLPRTYLQFQTSSISEVSESAGTTGLAVRITNPHPTNTTDVDVVLISGNAARIDNFTSQNISWNGGDGASKTLTLNVIDDPTCSSDEELIFELQNPTGGDIAGIGTNSQFTLILTDDELIDTALAFQGFEGTTIDNWGILNGAGAISTAVGDTDYPVNERILTGNNSWQTNDISNTLELAPIVVSAATEVWVNLRVSSTSTSSTDGVDARDKIEVFVDLDGAGFPSVADIKLIGNENDLWGYSTGIDVISTTAGTPVNVSTNSGSFSYLRIAIPNGTSTVALKIKAKNDGPDEIWNIDDISMVGSVCYVPPPTVQISMKLILGGTYDISSGLMYDDLRVANYVPSNEPFTALGFVRINGGGEVIEPNVLDVSGNDAIVDWVLLELRDKDSNTNIMATTAALLQRDGDVVAIDGISPVELFGSDGDYFVSVRHRNHFGTMVMNAVTLNSSPASIDLTNGSLSTYGTEAQNVLANGVNVQWTGDVNLDHSIKYTGSGNDRDAVLSVVGGTVPTNTISGYHLEDVNMDGVVKYTGTNNDRDMILVNIGGSVPTAFRVEQLP